jgi:hypothetical protein
MSAASLLFWSDSFLLSEFQSPVFNQPLTKGDRDMLSINSQILVRTLGQIRTGLGLRSSATNTVQIAGDGDGTTLSCRHAGVAVTCRLDIPNPPVTFNLPLHLPCSLRGSAQRWVTLTRQPSGTLVDHWDGTARRIVVWQNGPELEPVARADYFLDNAPRLATSLLQAAGVADDNSSRYALGCLYLRGRDGLLAATDGHQALIERGFALPVDEVLLPAACLRRLKVLERASHISVGLSGQWLQLRFTSGLARWEVDLELGKEARYPTLEQCFPDPDKAQTRIQFGDADARYLIEQLPRALGNRDRHPVTLVAAHDRASGQPSVSLLFGSPESQWLSLQGAAANSDQTSVVELLLCDSSFELEPCRLAVNHLNLVEALRLGFRHFYLSARHAPVLGCQDRRQFVFSVLDDQYLVPDRQPAISLQTLRPELAA